MLDEFKSIMIKEATTAVNSINNESIAKAGDMIIEAKNNGNRLHISGIGKPGHIAGYIASLYSSTGTPSYFLHGTELMHGSAGQLVKGDVAIFISNSGNTDEMKLGVRTAKNNGAKIIGVTGNKDSWLANEADVVLLAHVDQEGGPLNKAPRASIIAELIELQALSVYLQKKRGLEPEEYVKWHPSGALGKL